MLLVNRSVICFVDKRKSVFLEGEENIYKAEELLIRRGGGCCGTKVRLFVEIANTTSSSINYH